MTTSYQINQNLFLVSKSLPTNTVAKSVSVPINHICLIDCSGSMGYDLPKIREQLKKKLPKLLKEGDTFSAIWFSGKGEFGTLFEAEPVNTLKDLKDVNQAIDRWLRPVGMTGFKEPLTELSKLVDKILKNRPGTVCSAVFLSDGHDNQWNKSDILKAVEKVAGNLASMTFVEYGYYADRPLMASMAEKSGGSVIFAEDFDRYAPSFEKILNKELNGSKKVTLPIEGDPLGGFAFMLDQGDLITFGLTEGSITVPEGTKEVYYVSGKSIGDTGMTISTLAQFNPELVSPGGKALSAAYAALSLFSQRMKSDVVFPILKAVGDVRLIDTFVNCFGKQKYSEFMETSKQAALGVDRYLAGYDPNRVPREDAFTVLDLLRVLSEDEGNKVLLDDPSFQYSRISRGRQDASEQLTEEELQEVQAITAAMVGEKDIKKIKSLQEKLASLTSGKPDALKFVANKQDGYSIASLTYKEDRPNISLLVSKYGVVDLSSRYPDSLRTVQEGYKPVPEKFRTYIYRNYAIVRDGLVNVKTLPVKLTEATKNVLLEQVKLGTLPMSLLNLQLTEKPEEGFLAHLDLGGLPVINRKMVKAVSAKVLFEKQYELTQQRAAQKVYNTYQKEAFPKKSEGFAALYGEEAATWLKEQGLTDYGGFAPKCVQAESTDVYTGKELSVSLKGLASLPTLKDVKTRIASGKLTASASLMVPYVNEVEGFLASDAYTKAESPPRAFEAWLEARTKMTTNRVRELIAELAELKFSITVGQIWPHEFESLDQNSMTVTVAGATLECKLEMQEVEVKI